MRGLRPDCCLDRLRAPPVSVDGMPGPTCGAVGRAVVLRQPAQPNVNVLQHIEASAPAAELGRAAPALQPDRAETAFLADAGVAEHSVFRSVVFTPAAAFRLKQAPWKARIVAFQSFPAVAIDGITLTDERNIELLDGRVVRQLW
jgi:hypothetical protein